MFNHGGECGIGNVVPWAGRLWATTYSPHDPLGNDHDGLHEITPDLEIIKRKESIGGTSPGRLIHRESQQLFIGPYAIDEKGNVRVIPYERMPGRHTAIARHLTEPSRKVYYFTMEEGMYEVDVNTLEVRTLYLDSNMTPDGNDGGPRLPGYHGKGGYSGQGFAVYANNGRIGTGGITGGGGLVDLSNNSGCLAAWDGTWGGELSSEGWQIIHERQFTEVTGPGGIQGNESEGDPVWSTGWDHRSLILKLLDNGEWSTFRLPKADYSYGGLHGWHTEWPRIRQVGPEGQYLMNHHGMWFDFPGEFSEEYHPAPRPIASHLKITGDFARWEDQIVFGCDDNAVNRWPGSNLTGQSHSNLWFSTWEQLKDNGNPYGWGGPWVSDEVQEGRASDPFAFPGFRNRQLHLSQLNNYPITFKLEIDKDGRGNWEELTSLTVPAHGYIHHKFSDKIRAEWIRLTPEMSGKYVTAYFHLGKGGGVQQDPEMFKALAPASPKSPRSVGLLYTRGEDTGTLQFGAWSVDADGKTTESGYYEMDEDLKLKKVDDENLFRDVKQKASIEADGFKIDEASVIITDHWDNRYRLPKGDPAFDNPTEFGIPRMKRELATERDTLNLHGSIYYLPRENSGGVANMKPIATHNKRITDFCTWRGLTVLAGCRTDFQEESEHFRMSDDGKVGLWIGDYDDLWKLGKPKGVGGPWKNTDVQANIPSDPYIMTGYDKKSLELSHNADSPIVFTIELNVTRNFIAVSDQFGRWSSYENITVQPGDKRTFHFPEGFSAHWVRLVADKDCNASAIFTYT
ncbi:hypothetical protein ACG2F4_09380 [Halalkalibaculum sp. DA3122]|uniref:hypothetical protein n=1 Tax=Halalkalibaculum sp. DA3122 TaxID=3373607 RepID=UPI003754874D